MWAEYRKEHVIKVNCASLESTNLDFFSALDTSFLNVDTNSSFRRGLKSAEEQDRWWRRNASESWRAAETAEQRSERLRKQRERDHARRTAQTACEKQATSQWKSTRERKRMPAETPEEREARSQRDDHQPARKIGSWNPRRERNKIIAVEHQPVRKVGS